MIALHKKLFSPRHLVRYSLRALTGAETQVHEGYGNSWVTPWLPEYWQSLPD